MAHRTYKLKKMNNQVFSLTTEGCENVEDFRQKIVEHEKDIWNNKYKTVKLIHAGKIIETDEQFNGISDGDTIIVFPVKISEKKNTAPAPAPAPVHAPVPAPASAHAPVQTHMPMMPAVMEQNINSVLASHDCNYREAHAAMILMTKFIHDNPQLRQMFDGDFPTLVAYLNGLQLKDIFKSMLDQSGSILHAMDTGGTIMANIGNGATVDNVALTPHDQANIDSLIKMGFPGEQVVKLYINSGKNFDTTLEQLLAFAEM